MFKTICAKYPKDTGLPARAWQLARYRDVYEGTIYDCLENAFAVERNSSGEYIPIHQRRPSVRYNLCRIVVEDSVSLLFGDGRFPALYCDEESARARLAELVKATELEAVMAEAALRGSVGSVAIRMRVLDSRLFFDSMDTDFLTPKWQDTAPDTLESVTEKYKTTGAQLAEAGYSIAPDDMPVTFWFQRVWGVDEETYFVPWKLDAKGPNNQPYVPVVDTDRTVAHGLGFVPIVWIKNLPGGAGPDGGCTFAAAINTQMEIEYQLSQAGRGLRYSSDPTLLIKEPAYGEGGEMVKSPSTAITVSKDGDAKLLEINGTAAEAVIGYVRFLREMALEAIHGNRSTPEKLGSVQSGRAIELLHESLINLAGRLRLTYGNGLLSLVKMVERALETASIKVGDEALSLPENVNISLRWGPWFHPTPQDRVSNSQALKTLAESGQISRESAVAQVCGMYDIEDATKELAQIESDQRLADERAARIAALGQTQVKVADPVPE